jgi:acyl dehydratase
MNEEFVVTKDMAHQYASVTGDHNPIHFEGDTPIVHGGLLIGFISKMLAEVPGTIWADVDARFLRPVLVGQTVSFNLVDYPGGTVIINGFVGKDMVLHAICRVKRPK